MTHIVSSSSLDEKMNKCITNCFILQEELMAAYNDVCTNQIRPVLTKLFKKIPESKLM